MRRLHNWTQREIAAKLDTLVANYTRYELGARVPDIDTIIKLAEIYQVSIDYLVGRTDEAFYACVIPTKDTVVLSTDPNDFLPPEVPEKFEGIPWMPRTEPEFRAYVMELLTQDGHYD